MPEHSDDREAVEPVHQQLPDHPRYFSVVKLHSLLKLVMIVFVDFNWFNLIRSSLRSLDSLRILGRLVCTEISIVNHFISTVDEISTLLALILTVRTLLTVILMLV